MARQTKKRKTSKNQYRSGKSKLSYAVSQLGEKVKVGRTKQGNRYSSVIRKGMNGGGYIVKTTIIKNGKKIELISSKYVS